MKTMKKFRVLLLCAVVLFFGCDKNDSLPSLKNLKAGMLEEVITSQKMENATSLTLGGEIDKRDFAYMKRMMIEGSLSEIDLKDATIVAFGKKYPAGEIPREAFMINNKTGDAINNPYLKKFIFPEHLISIGIGAFYRCSGLSGSLTIPEGVTSIEEAAFNGCLGFNGSLTIPNSITSIGQYAFGGCSNFTGSLLIPNSVTSMGRSAFAHCSGFAGSLTISSGVTSIENGTFYFCSGFTGSLTIPENITSIGSSAFCFCSGFTGSLVIPTSVLQINEHAFSACESLSDIKVSWPSPIKYNGGMFPSDKTIYVPSAFLPSYQSSWEWKYYTLVGY